MKTNPMKDGALTENRPASAVTGEMVRERAIELAAMDGRPADAVSRSDREQARQDLTGDPGVDANSAALEATPESDRWTQVSGSGGHKVDTAPGEDEDSEGRSDDARLVIEGVAQAEHDQRRQATAPE